MRTISIGDLHGLDVWKKAIEDINTFDKVIFVGDYVDSFDVSAVIQLHNLKEIIELKKEYPEKVVLLLGNHDVQYMNYPDNKCSGFQTIHQFDYTQLFRENRRLFQAAYQIENTLWTHAGVHIGWYNQYCKKYHDAHPEMTLADIINRDYELNRYWLYNVGYLRGGSSDVGGPFWLDSRNAWKKPIKDYHQIFGHTRISTGTIMKKDINDDTSVTCIDVLEDGSPKFHLKAI